MPELPEVETTRRGLLPHVVGHTVNDVVVRNPNLRWPVPGDLRRRLRGEKVLAVRRRGKYLLFDFPKGHLLVHLGMSGRLSLIADDAPVQRHDHFDLLFGAHRALRLTDPRRFGAVLWLPDPAEKHSLLSGLGLEPLERGFTGKALHERSRGRSVAVKQFLMNGRIVTGVGNIYANEALWGAQVHPLRSVSRISLERWNRIAESVRATLNRAIEAGGTTLRDFAGADGQLGHFQLHCAVYGREGKPCPRCGEKIRSKRQGQRSTFFCPRCQK